MKSVSLALAAVVAMLALGQGASLAADASGQTASASKQVFEFSAARKQRLSPFVTYLDPYTGEEMTVYRRNYLVPSNDFEGGNFAGNYALRRAEGRCVIDLGYGRYEHC